jgi:DNA-binding LytR/AlgR family response regulator
MSITTYIIDDEPHAIAVLQRYINMTPGLILKGYATDPLQALEELHQNGVQLLFTDIDMPVLTGIDIAGLIKATTKIVFTTSFREFGAEAFEKNALDYLLKPISYERFLSGVQKFRGLDISRVQPTNALFINAGIKGKLIRVIPEELIHIKGAQNFVHLHFVDKTLLVFLTLQDILDQLPPQLFVRIHKSHIVNICKIAVVEGGYLRMENEEQIPIGRTYHEAFNQRLRELTVARGTAGNNQDE